MAWWKLNQNAKKHDTLATCSLFKLTNERRLQVAKTNEVLTRESLPRFVSSVMVLPSQLHTAPTWRELTEGIVLNDVATFNKKGVMEMGTGPLRIGPFSP